MYARETDDGILTFDFAWGLLDDNLLFVDRETRSLWSQLHGRAISGPRDGSPLRSVPAIQTTWKHWRDLHPTTRVVDIDSESGRPYFYRNRKPGVRPATPDADHDTSLLGLGVVIDGSALFLPLEELNRVESPYRVKLGTESILIHHRKDAMTAWATNQEGEMLSTVLAYRDGWLSFFPDSTIFEHQK